jgi:hypothetical protein
MSSAAAVTNTRPALGDNEKVATVASSKGPTPTVSQTLRIY